MGRPSYFRPLLATFDLHEDQFYDLMWSIECRDSHTENLFESFYAQLNDSKVSQDCIDLVETIKDRLPFQAPDFSRPDLPADAEYWAQVRAMREAAPELADFVDIWVPQGPGGDPLYYRIADKVNEFRRLHDLFNDSDKKYCKRWFLCSVAEAVETESTLRASLDVQFNYIKAIHKMFEQLVKNEHRKNERDDRLIELRAMTKIMGIVVDHSTHRLDDAKRRKKDRDDGVGGRRRRRLSDESSDLVLYWRRQEGRDPGNGIYDDLKDPSDEEVQSSTKDRQRPTASSKKYDFPRSEIGEDFVAEDIEVYRGENVGGVLNWLAKTETIPSTGRIDDSNPMRQRLSPMHLATSSPLKADDVSSHHQSVSPMQLDTPTTISVQEDVPETSITSLALATPAIIREGEENIWWPDEGA